MRKEQLHSIEIVLPVKIFSGYHRRSATEIDSDAAELLTAIREHRWGKDASIRRVTRAVCSFCGYTWTEGALSRHNGGCCDKDAANIPRSDAEGAKA